MLEKAVRQRGQEQRFSAIIMCRDFVNIKVMKHVRKQIMRRQSPDVITKRNHISGSIANRKTTFTYTHDVGKIKVT